MDFDEDPNYLDLEDILAHTQTVNCKFLLDIPGLEFLAPGRSVDINPDTELLLPFWMAKTLYTYSMIDVDLPKTYNAHFREVLEAEASVVDLHRAGPHFYKFGKLLIDLKREKGNNLELYTEEGQRNKYRREEGETLEERKSIATSLMKTFHSRRPKLLEFSINPCKDTTQARKEFETRMDNMEKRLYQLGKQQATDQINWNSSNKACKKPRFKR